MAFWSGWHLDSYSGTAAPAHSGEGSDRRVSDMGAVRVKLAFFSVTTALVCLHEKMEQSPNFTNRLITLT